MPGVVRRLAGSLRGTDFPAKPQAGYYCAMGTRSDDDDDWVGTPPEGRYTRDRADASHWTRNWPAQTIVYGLIGLGIVVVVLIALLA
ncbi:MAG: hypothetical protein QOK49_3905 [Baekduia sp.]|nr:hypothetical protein [Baekduia sp.]